jgi:hypothetical protein
MSSPRQLRLLGVSEKGVIRGAFLAIAVDQQAEG